MGTIKLVIFDIAGTTAHDDGLVVEAFQSAMIGMGINTDTSELITMTEYVNKTMGQRKIDVFTHLFGGDAIRAEIAHLKFVDAYRKLIESGRMVEFQGVTDMFKDLQAKDIGVALTTGFPRVLLSNILAATHWDDFINITVASDEVDNGRPAPDMIKLCIELYNVKSSLPITPAHVAVVGDTKADIASGIAARAMVVAGVTTGAHSKAELLAAGATHILDSALDILTIC